VREGRKVVWGFVGFGGDDEVDDFEQDFCGDSVDRGLGLEWHVVGSAFQRGIRTVCYGRSLWLRDLVNTFKSDPERLAELCF
jgi:hypothetical protein